MQIISENIDGDKTKHTTRTSRNYFRLIAIRREQK